MTFLCLGNTFLTNQTRNYQYAENPPNFVNSTVVEKTPNGFMDRLVFSPFKALDPNDFRVSTFPKGTPDIRTKKKQKHSRKQNKRHKKMHHFFFTYPSLCKYLLKGVLGMFLGSKYLLTRCLEAYGFCILQYIYISYPLSLPTFRRNCTLIVVPLMGLPFPSHPFATHHAKQSKVSI